MPRYSSRAIAGAGLDEQALHLLALRAGLVRDELHAEDGLRVLVGLLDGLGELDATALAAATGVNLRLDDDDRIAGGEELLGGRVGLFQRGGHFTGGDGNAVLPQDLLGLILVDLHARSSAARVTLSW